MVYNFWYATGFDVSVEHQLRLADAAAEIEIEVFVVDDRWFRGRTSDRSGLGDWEVDPQKFPQGLEELVDGIRSRGMRFGLWIESEAVNPDSDLHRTHPDWVHHVSGRPSRTLRNQYMLDLGRPEVEAWVTDVLRSLLSRYDITYLKWDMNRSIEGGGRSVPGGDGWSWRHTLAYYRMLDVIREEFPHVAVEGCSGDGGRIDGEVLARTDVVWPSDETGPRDRLAMQHRFLSAYPSWVMSSWATDEPDIIDQDPISWEFRFVVAMAGVVGIGSDLLAWDEATRGRARELVALYRSVLRFIWEGTVHRHGEPADEVCAVQYTAEDAVVVLAWRRPGESVETWLPLAGLRPEDRSTCEGEELNGQTLCSSGLLVGWRWGDCDVVVLRRSFDPESFEQCISAS